MVCERHGRIFLYPVLELMKSLENGGISQCRASDTFTYIIT